MDILILLLWVALLGLLISSIVYDVKKGNVAWVLICVFVGVVGAIRGIFLLMSGAWRES